MTQLEVFHGSRQRFEQFDVSFKGTGESGDINACWFTDNFTGASHHALLKNRNDGDPLVYHCLLSSKSVIVDLSKPLIEQPEILDRITRHLPVMLGTSLIDRPHSKDLIEPVYKVLRGKTQFTGFRNLDQDQVIKLYKSCGVHGIYNWESYWTDDYVQGSTTILFDFSELKIVEVIEV